MKDSGLVRIKLVICQNITFTSKQFNGGTVSYDLIKPIQPDLISDHTFIGYIVSEQIAGTTNKVKTLLVQRITKNQGIATFNSENESGIKIAGIDK
ncbi:hypothetical protein IMAU70004_02909 [Lactiplantibacillus plantarum]|nr:hypothetical protein [Lactiplantibacillus plantarum]